MGIRTLIVVALAGAYAVMWMGGVVSYVFLGGPPADAAWTAPLFLFLAGMIVIVTTGLSSLAGLVVVMALGFAFEVAGVRYGFIFGEYVYTDNLPPRLFGVPVVMASAWLALVAYIKQMMRAFRLRGWMEIFIASLWMTAIDLVIDPLASGHLGYWRWKDEGWYYGVPAHNFLGWFVVSLLIFAVVKRMKWQNNKWSLWVGLSIILFFTIIALAEGLLLAGGIGLMLCIVHFAISSWSRRGLLS